MMKFVLKALYIFSFLLCIFLFGCVTTPQPKSEYVLAKIAIDAAKAVQAARYSPGFWHQAEESYRRAKILYSEREHEQARQLFENARISAEKAENSARLIRQKNGDVL